MTTVSITPHQYSSNHCYPDSVFIGGFSVDSPEYTRSCTYSRVRANQPGISRWYYETKVITYITQCSASVPYALFALNHPIAVTTGLVDANHNPFALYGMVRGITSWSETVPMEINYSVTVEVHIRPGFTLDWSQTLPWPFIPVGAIFLCPHAFQNPNHQPVPITPGLVDQMATVHYNARNLNYRIDTDWHTLQHMNRQLRPLYSNSRQTEEERLEQILAAASSGAPPATSTTIQLADDDAGQHSFIIYSQRTGEPVTGNSSDEDEDL